MSMEQPMTTGLLPVEGTVQDRPSDADVLGRGLEIGRAHV